MEECDVIFVCVPTPMKKDGSIDLSYVDSAVGALYEFKREENNPIIVIKSTIVPETTQNLQEKYLGFRFAVNPEFMRMGSSLSDFLNPDRIVVGTEESTAKQILEKLYEEWKCPKIFTNSKTAEMIKYTSNAFLTMKVAFACEIAEICNFLEIDSSAVMNAVGMDKRINHSHLNPVLGKILKNSACLPKDIMALIKYLQSKGYQSRFLEMVHKVGVES